MYRIMCRFASLSVAETQPVLFCTEKQETDKKIMAGLEHKVPKSTPHLDRPLYYDPSDNELQIIQHYRRQDLKEEQRRREARQYQKLLKTIPKVDYFPTTRLAEMQAKSSSSRVDSDDLSSSFVTGADLGNAGASELEGSFGASQQQLSKYSSVLSQAGDWQNVEHNMKLAMKAAKAGDRKALFEYNMRNKLLAPIDSAPDI